MKNNLTSREAEEALDALLESPEFDLGVIEGGLCVDAEAQAEFDRVQKGQPPLTDD